MINNDRTKTITSGKRNTIYFAALWKRKYEKAYTGAA